MVFKAIQMIKTIRNDEGNDKKDNYFTVFVISIQYESTNLPVYTEMDDKNDIKG